METPWEKISIPKTWRFLGNTSWKGSDGRLYEAATNVYVRIYCETTKERWGLTMRDNRERKAKYTALVWNKKTEQLNEILNNEITQLIDLNDEEEED
jgi:hypothetical protein